ncbi:ABC transporter permease [Hymenobacter crusticola]|uniref:Transporter permease n=1 Tax=Hymenobacter crusticola TaxID=1770526 RepID=A0A243W5N1_9BACT|nr:ABC transporter permease [Hymenobacter crusticola]OUJ68389.1 transporter permease [Hymenobacter crusticola]
MFQHSLLLIYRNFKRFPTTFFINLIGLSTGLACALAVCLWVNDELSFDKYHANNSRLFRVMENVRTEKGLDTHAGTTALLAEALVEEMPEIESAVVATPPAFFPRFTLVGEKKHIQGVGKFAAKSFFHIFSYSLVQGNANQVLANKRAIVLSQRLATSLFGKPENAIGKTVEWQLADLKQTCIVSGIFGPIPANSSEQFDFVLTFDAFKDIMKMGPKINWEEDGPFNTYIVLHDGVDPKKFNSKIAGLLDHKTAKNKNRRLFIQPYSDQYLHGEYKNGVQAGGRIEYVQLFSAIAAFILIIACINYMNLATAKATRRMKEIGVKKTLGASRRALVMHFLLESTLMTFLALFLAVVLVQVVLPQFNEVTGKHLTLTPEPKLIILFLGIALLTGLLAGSYPAFYLSGFKPATVFRGTLVGSVADLWTRKGLVIFQFTLSVIFIVCVLVVHRQMQFVQSKDLGYDKNNVIYFETAGRSAQEPNAFLAEIKRLPGVVNASGMWGFFVIVGPQGVGPQLEWKGRKIPVNNLGVNYDMVETLGIQMKAGRSFSRQFRSDSTEIIVNETLVKTLGLQDPIGKTLNRDKVVGVAKDFYYESLHEKVAPFIFRLEPKAAGTVVVKLAPGQDKETIRQLQQFYKAYNAGMTLDYQYLDAEYQAQYASERRVAVLSRYFASLAILISSLGLWGLTAFTAEKRRKEIGVRKVLGASEFSIIYLLSRDLTKLVIVAIALALPISYLLVRHWLDSFEYRIALEFWYFLGAGLLALLVAWLTVGAQAVRAARIDPALCLRDE